MRLMLIHVNRFSFEVTEKTNVAGFVGELSPGEERGKLAKHSWLSWRWRAKTS